MRFDWKYSFALIAAIAGVAVPVMLWQFDLKAKSINVKLVSSAELQSPIASSLPNLKISIDGDIVFSPVLSIIEITNDGSKPIPTVDFESPLEVSIINDAKLVRANLISMDPVNLKPELELKNQSILIKPLLLNPNDKLIISILSSGKMPTIQPNARISGIQSINYSNNSEFSNTPRKLVRAIASTIGLGLYFVYMAAFLTRKNNKISASLSLISIATMGILSANGIAQTLKAYDFDITAYPFWIVIIFIIIFGVPIFYYSIKSFQRTTY